MAKATKYIAHHDGRRFERNSHRTYTHCVIEQGFLHEDRERAADAARYDWKTNRGYHLAKAEDRCPIVAKYPDHYPPERIAKDKANAIEWLAKGKAGLVAEALARFDARNAGKPDEYWGCIGWCGRLDLARKLAATGPRTKILEATVG